MNEPNRFTEAIAQAASHIDHGVADPSAEVFAGANSRTAKPSRRRPQNERDAQAEAEAAFAAEAARITDKHGCAIIWDKPRAARRKTRAEYGFWKGPVTAFIEFPEMLDLGPTDLARRFGPSEANFTVTKDTFRAHLSAPARKEAGKLLESHGYKLKLPANFSIRDVQMAMRDQRDRAAGVKRFNPKVEIVGDTVYCDGKSYKMQPTASGKMRIRTAGGSISVDALAAFLSGRP